MTRRSWMLMLMLCGLALGLASSVCAQNSNSGDIRGTVTDSSGRVIPGVNVTVTNNDTGVISNYATNSDGIYDTNSILPGSYTLQFRKATFETFKRGPVTLQVGIITVDAVLRVGSTTEVVEVNSSDVPMLKTEDAQVSTTLALNELSELPNVDPANGWTYLLKLLPGATSTPAMGGGGGGGGGDQDPGVDQAIGGTMPYFSSYLVDGGSIWLPHSANIDQGLSEAVSEVNVIATDAPAQYGGGGTVFNVISKNGGNQFHGSLYENFQNDDLDARSYFNSGAKAKQRFNYYGGAVGGPILKDKLFFYYNFQQLKNPNSTYSTFSVPSADMKAGCFDPAIFGNALTLDAAHGGANLTTNAAQCDNFNPNDLAIPTADFDPVAKNIQALFPAPNLSGLQNNYSYLRPGNGNSTKDFGRLDYNVTNKNRVSISVTMHEAPHKTNYDPGPVCPINCENNASEGYNAQITDVFTISSSLVNEFRQSFVRQGNWFVPQSLGKGYPANLGMLFSSADVFPSVNISGTDGPGGLGPGTNAVFIENTFVPSEMLTLIKGKHILHFGGEVMFEQDNSTPWGSINGATVQFSGQYTTSNSLVSEVGYADFLLGDVYNWSTSTQPSHEMRAKNFSLFAQDDIKIRANLTINLGVRSETHGGFNENHNSMGGFDPTLANPVASPGPAFPVNSMGSIWFAGASGERSQEFETKTIVMPRLGFAYTLTPKSVIRGGVGQYSALWSMDTVGGPVGFGTGVTGNLVTSSATTPVVQLSGTGSNLPIISGRNPASYILPTIAGQTVVEGDGFIPYTPNDLGIMNGWQWTAGVQRTLPLNMVAEAEYVGSHWNNLMFEADINQLPAGKLGGGAAARPYPQFTGIGVGSGGSRTGSYNGISNYQAAELMLHMPTSHGLAVEAAYTWSRLYDDMDSSGWGNQFGSVYYQDAYTPSANYGPSNFNRENTFKATVLYMLPVGKGHQLLNSTLGDAVLGGWQASGAIVAYSGSPFTVIMSSSQPSGSLGGNGGDGNAAAALYPDLTGNPGSGGHSIKQWFNPGAYTAPAANTFGTNKRNSLYGPGVSDVDFSLAKSWGLGWESSKFQLRMDANDLFNHPSFQDPNSTIGNSGVGQITGTTINGRTIQLSGRFSF